MKPLLTHPYQWIDWLYLNTSKAKLFTGGWGDLEIIDNIVAQSQSITPPVDINITIVQQTIVDGFMHYHGEFLSPSPYLPKESATARFLLIAPIDAKTLYDVPVCISMPGSGDEGYNRRLKALAKPLAKKGIATIILENPLYGSRRPCGQNKHYSNSVSDFLIMFYSAIQECKALIHHWASNGQKKIAITGSSMGGQAVAVTASQVPNRLAVVPSFAPSCVADLYAYGYLGEVCNWKALSEKTDENAARKQLNTILKIGNIENFPAPTQSISRVINAKHDTYIPAHLSNRFKHHWHHANVDLISGGHISSILFKNKRIAQEIATSLDAL